MTVLDVLQLFQSVFWEDYEPSVTKPQTNFEKKCCYFKVPNWIFLKIESRGFNLLRMFDMMTGEHDCTI